MDIILIISAVLILLVIAVIPAQEFLKSKATDILKNLERH